MKIRTNTPELVERACERLSRWIDIPSISGHEEDYARSVGDTLARLGFEVELRPVAPGRPNVLARRGSGRILLCTHLDTVPPHFPAHREADRITGRGACDAKGILTCMVAAAEQLVAAGAGDLTFLLVVGEEVDHAGAKAAGAYDLRADVVLLGEPSECVLMRAQKGILKIRLSARGRAAHSGYPEQGESAIDKLLRVLDRLDALPLGQDRVLGSGLKNVGLIHGGVAANVVAPAAEAELMFRTVGPGADLVAEIERLAAGDVAIEVAALTDPVRLHVLEGYPTGTAGFGTDAPYLAGIGPVVLAGPGSILDAHTADEHLTLAQVEAGIALYRGLVERVLAGEQVLPA